MGLFTKYCEVCGVKVDRNRDTVRFGKHFCSDDHARQYVTQMKQGQSPVHQKKSGDGCECG